MIEAGPDKAYMQRERQLAADAMTTPDCRHGDCGACGVCDFKEITNMEAPATMPQPDETPKEPVWGKFRLFFEKKETAAMMSALDLSRIIAMAMTGAGVRFKFSQGFNPSPRMMIYAPMPVGVAGEVERLYFEADINGIDESIIEKINKRSPAGLKFFQLDKEAWPENLSRAKIKLVFDAESFDFIMKSLESNEAFYEKTDKRGRPKQVQLTDFLLESFPEERALRLAVTEKGGFHFPDFFRFREQEIADIRRVELDEL
jgi:radical SAM-linked protein